MISRRSFFKRMAAVAVVATASRMCPLLDAPRKLSTRWTTELSELPVYDMDIRQILVDNAIKDMKFVADSIVGTTAC